MQNKNLNISQKHPGQPELRAELYQGILPHPDLIKKFEELYPGAAKFFFDEI